MGENNPMAKNSTMPKCIVFDKDNNPIKLFEYPYQITEFFNSVFGNENHKNNSGASGNISKALKAKGYINSKGFLFKNFDECSTEIQDIVRLKCESILQKDCKDLQ